MTTLPPTLPPTGSAAKARPAYFDNTAGAETPGQFDAPLPKPAPEKKARPIAYDPTAGAETPEASHTADAPEMSFWDLVDVVNPLQHLPIVGTIYRQLTGDTIGGAARIMGGALYGGPIGMLAGFAETLFEQTTGADYGTTVAQLVTGKPDENTSQLAMAESAKPAAGAPMTGLAGAGAAAAGTAAARTATPTAEKAVQTATAAAGAPEAAADNAAKAASASPLFRSLQKATKPGHALATGPIIEIRPAKTEQAQTPAAAAPVNTAAATEAAAPKAGNPTALPPQLVADMMMGALDKYAKMKQPGDNAGPTIDKAL